MDGDRIVQTKSFSFAVRMVKLFQYMTETKKEYVLSKQILRSGTSIGANIREAQQAQSKKDFMSKMSVALKEADETEYWIDLLHETDYLDDAMYVSIIEDCRELQKMLISIVKSLKGAVDGGGH